jgi:SAM-dependent methyltransferase
MTEGTARHDAWQAGDSYEAYMGRWSRAVAPRFLDWLAPAEGLDWLELGCGTGALSAAILDRGNPASLIGVDPSDDFLAKARAALPDPRATFRRGDAQDLDLPPASRDVIVSALMLNFVPARDRVLAGMRRTARPGGTVAFYVWDYPGGGLELVHAFWKAAASLDPAAAALSEDRRFPFCTPELLAELAARAGLVGIETVAIEVPTVFRDFEDYWRPFTLGAGPAPGYCASLDPAALQRLRDRLHDSLPRAADGTIPLTARAWALKARVD